MKMETTTKNQNVQMEESKEMKKKLSLSMFQEVRDFKELDRDNLVVCREGQDAYVPFVVRQLWFRTVFDKGTIKAFLVGTFEEMVRNGICVFSAEVYDNENHLLAVSYGSATTEEPSFVETAQRRAVNNALANAGFTWHNGDFQYIDSDVAKNQLDKYMQYINQNTLDCKDKTVQELYEDALVTIIPSGYGNDSGRPISAMNSHHLEQIALNYGIVADGCKLTNAKIKFVHLYQSMQNAESTKQNIAIVEEDKPKKRGKKKEVKEELQEKTEETQDETMQIVKQEKKTNMEQAEEDMVFYEQKSEVFTPDGFTTVTEEMENDENPFAEEQNTELEEKKELFDSLDFNVEDNEFCIKEMLHEWGYTTEKDLTENWPAYFKKVRERSQELNFSDVSEVRKFIENVLVCDDFLWSDKMNKEKIVLLGDFLESHKEEVEDILEKKVSIPLNSLKPLMEYYASNVWDNF